MLGGTTILHYVGENPPPPDLKGLIKAEQDIAMTMQAAGGILAVEALIESVDNPAPVVTWFGGLLGSAPPNLAALAAALYAALAVSAVLALSGAARATEVAQLRTLGLSGRQSVWLIVAEHGPTVAVAFVVGVVLGVALFAFLRPGLGLGSIIGSDVAVPLQVDPAYLVVVFATVVGIVAIGIGIAAAIQRRAVPALAVRRRME